MLKYILLEFLNYRPMTGCDLKKWIDQSTAHFWHAYHSQIYTTLRKMEADGLVQSACQPILASSLGRPSAMPSIAAQASSNDGVMAWLMVCVLKG